MKKVIFFIFTLLVTIQISAGNNYYFRSLGIDKGLSHATVMSILSNDRGLLWIGTAFGLNVYNGHEMKSYFHKNDNPNSLPGNTILLLVEDAQKNIWVSTQNGLVMYDQNKDYFVSPVKGSHIKVYSYYCTSEGVLFGGNKELYYYNYLDKKFRTLPLKGDISSIIAFIQEWKKGVYLLFFSDGTIKELDYSTGVVRPSVFARQTGGVMATYIDKDRNLYLSVYQQGIYIYDANGKEKYHLTTANSDLTYDLILDMKEKDGKLWMATDGGGINIMDLKDPQAMTSICHLSGDENSLPSNSMDCLYKDSQNNMWAGSIREGVIEIKETFIHTYKDVMPGNKFGLSNKTVISMCQDRQGAVWIGTDGGGVNRFNPDDQTFVHYPSTYNEKIVSIVDYSPTELLLLRYLKNPLLFNKQTGKCTPYKLPSGERYYAVERIYKIYDDFFVVLSAYPYIFNSKTNLCYYLKFKGIPEEAGDYKIVGMTGDYLYLLKGNSLMKADLKTYEVSLIYKTDDSEDVQIAAYDPSGVFWIGTDYGLRCYNPFTREYKKIETNLFERVSALVPEDGARLWIGAQNSLFSYDIKESKFFAWGESDGFSPNELLNIYQPPIYNNEMYLGGSHGFVQIDKSIKSAGSVQPDIMLADVVVDGVSVLHKNKLTKESVVELAIPWDYKLLQVRVVAIDKDVFGKKLFRYSIFKYSMQGNENKVVETYSPIISLDMLSPGEYSVHASFYTENGIWSTPVQVIHLNVIAPWYKDYRVLLGSIVLILVLLVWWLLIYLQRKEERMKWRMNEMLQKADREKIQFLINISHELRTPLTLIYAPLKKMLEVVDRKEVNTEEQVFLKRQLVNIHKSASHMKAIINMTLDVNRIGDKEDALHIRSHRLNEWIVSIVEEFEYEFEARGITLKYQLDENISQFEFDDRKCDAVLSNLLMNALKFSPEHTEITVISRLKEAGIYIAVSDQGIGLDNLDTNLLFTRFYQGEHDEQGSGIGLSYSRILIEKQGGTIGAFNNPDKGATFYFELPYSKEHDAEKVDTIGIDSHEQLLMTDVWSEPEGAEFSTKPYSVVVVEDNLDLRSYLVDMLDRDFGTVYTASNGVEACKIITDRMPDIIISDIMMPLMDGYELCRKIKSDALTCHIPVVLLTARGDVHSTLTGYKLGADAYLPKPFELDFLLTMLRNLLKNREVMKQKYRETFIRITEDEAALQIANSDEEFLSRFNKLILDNLSSSELNVTYMTERMGISRSALYAKLKALTSMGVNDYINRIRIDKASQLLIRSNLSITEISEAVGFEYQKYFSTLFKQIKGVTPTQYRQQNVDKAGDQDE